MFEKYAKKANITLVFFTMQYILVSRAPRFLMIKTKFLLEASSGWILVKTASERHALQDEDGSFW